VITQETVTAHPVVNVVAAKETNGTPVKRCDTHGPALAAPVGNWHVRITTHNHWLIAELVVCDQCLVELTGEGI
jgi:hypothetical protein